MQLCDTGRDIRWSISQDLPPMLSDYFLGMLLDSNKCWPVETYPVALQEVVSLQKPITRAWKHDLFWLLIGGVFALIGVGVTMLIGNLWR